MIKNNSLDGLVDAGISINIEELDITKEIVELKSDFQNDLNQQKEKLLLIDKSVSFLKSQQDAINKQYNDIENDMIQSIKNVLFIYFKYYTWHLILYIFRISI